MNSAKPCPFCNFSVKKHPFPEWRKQYLAAYHDTDCWLNEHNSNPPYNFTLIPVNEVNKWNRRSL